MNQKDLDLVNAAAGYPKRTRRRKPKLKIKLTAEESHKHKLMSCQEVVDSVGGHRAKAAKILKIHERTLYRWLKELHETKDLMS